MEVEEDDEESSSLPDVTGVFDVLSRSTIHSHRSAVSLRKEPAEMFLKSISNQVKAQFGMECSRRRSSCASLVAWRDDHDQCQSDGALDEDSEENDKGSLLHSIRNKHSVCAYPRGGGGSLTREKKFKKQRSSRIVLKDWHSDGEASSDEREEHDTSFRAMLHTMNRKDGSKGDENPATPEYVTLPSQKNHKKGNENQTAPEYVTLPSQKDGNESNQHQTIPEYVTLFSHMIQNKNIREKFPSRRGNLLEGNSTETMKGGHDNQTKIESGPFMKDDASLRWWAMRHHFTG